MSAAVPPVPSPAPAASSRAWLGGLARGLGVFGVAAVLGQVPPLLIDLFGGGLSASTAVRLGWFYTLSFHRVGLRLTGLSITGDVTEVVTVHLALLSGTAVLGWLLYRAGAATLDASEGEASRERWIAAVCVAAGYGAPMYIVTLLADLRLATGGGFLPDAVTVSGIAWQAFVLPVGLAFVCAGAATALANGAPREPFRPWIVEGWRAFATAVGLALVGMMVLAAVRPSGTAWYVRSLDGMSARSAALVLGHQAATLPNQGVILLAAGLGSCERIVGGAGATDVLCVRTLPVFPQDDAGAWLSNALTDVSNGTDRVPTGNAPGAMWLLVLAPAIAVVWAGSRLGRGALGPRAALVRAVGAAVVFATLTGVGAWASGITLTIKGPGAESGRVVFGPRPWLTAVLALVWGSVGMGISAAAVSRSRPDDQAPGPPAG